MQRKVIKYTFAFCLVPSVPGNTLPHPEGEELPLSPTPVIFKGPSLGSAWLQASQIIRLFPLPAGEGALEGTGSWPPQLASLVGTHSEQASSLQLWTLWLLVSGNC